MGARKLQVLVVGWLPPPYFGPSVTYQALMRSPFTDQFDVTFIDQTVSRTVSELEQVQLRKLLLLARMVLQLAGHLARRKFDYCCFPSSVNRNAFLKEWLFMRVARLFRVPYVWYAHSNGTIDFYSGASPRIRRLVDDAFSRAAAAIVMGESLRFNFERWLPAEKIFVVGTGIEPTDLPPRSPRKDDWFTVLYLGNLIREKGVFVLLDAAAKVIAAHPGVRFVFAGDWKVDADRVEAERRIQELGLQANVTFAGVVWGDRKLQLLVDADAFVYPTFYPLEAHPLVVVEALQAGLPVVSTRWVAVPEIIEDGVNGLLAELRDPNDLAVKILLVIRDPTLRERMSRANRHRFEEFYTHNHYGNRMINVFETLAGRKGQPASDQQPAVRSGATDARPSDAYTYRQSE